MDVLLVGGSAVVGAGLLALAGGYIGETLNTHHDDLGIGEGLSMLFGAGVGSVAGAIGGAMLGAAFFT